MHRMPFIHPSIHRGNQVARWLEAAEVEIIVLVEGIEPTTSYSVQVSPEKSVLPSLRMQHFTHAPSCSAVLGEAQNCWLLPLHFRHRPSF